MTHVNDRSPCDSSKETYAIRQYFAMVLLSWLIKIPLIFYSYQGFITKNYFVASPDAFGYIVRAVNRDFHIWIGGHWLYEFINQWAADHLFGPDGLYLGMCFINLILSSAIPLALLPAIRALDLNSGERIRCFVLVSAFTLFWPTALWLSTQNLKDILLGLMFCTLISLILVSIKKGKVFPWLLPILGSFYLMFSLRSYLAAILAAATTIFILITRRSPRTYILASLGLMAFLLSPFGSYILDFLSPEKNWLLYADAAQEVQARTYETGEGDFMVTRTPAAFAQQLLLVMLNPFPTFSATSIYSLILPIKTVVISLFLTYFVVTFCQWKSGLRTFFTILFGFLLSFFAMAPSFAGPRQVFSSLDLCFLLLLSYFLTKHPNRPLIQTSLAIGLAISLGMLFLTSRGLT